MPSVGRASPYHWPMAPQRTRRARQFVAGALLLILPGMLTACASNGSSSSAPTTVVHSCTDLARANKALTQAVDVTTATPASLTSALKQFAKTLKELEGTLPASSAGEVKALKRQVVVTRIHLAGATTPTEFGGDLYRIRQDLKVIRRACPTSN